MEDSERHRTAISTFQEAGRTFLDELPEHDRSIFQPINSPEELVEVIRKYIESLKTQDRGRLLYACDRIDKFGKRMGPYFDIISIFVSTHPEWAGILWGALRLIFQLSSHYVQFFEKLTEMLYQITSSLPIYGKQVDLIRKRIQGKHKDQWTGSYDILMRSLSHVYVNILQFCHDSCQLFTKKSQGLRYKVRLISGRFWVPFDERFSTVLRRLKAHENLFESGLRLVYSEEMVHHFSTMEAEMEKNALFRGNCETQQESVEQNTIQQRLRMLQEWINPPNWLGIFESASRKRAMHTGTWLLKSAIYRKWASPLDPALKAEVGSEANILVIPGKPGYGKTVLSTRVIENLRQRASQLAATGSAGDCIQVAFFHFAQEHPKLSTPIAALQSLAAQILHEQRHDKNFIDIASVLMTEQGGGQLSATENVLRSLIGVYLRQFKASYIVIDGLDECSDWSEFYEYLLEFALKHSCKVVVFARPHLSICSHTAQELVLLELVGQTNLGDIQTYLEPRVHSLLETTRISGSLSKEYIISNLSKYADSIFLWAVLIIEYLGQSSLTPKDREEVIQGKSSFMGLDNLYAKILEGIEKRIPKKHHLKVAQIFQWLVSIQEPWSNEMLRVALSLREDRRTSKDEFLEERTFKKHLLELCGPLVEISPERKVRFIHLSVAEYLAEPEDNLVQHTFRVQHNIAHCSLSRLCLNYLLHEVQKEALGGSPSITADPVSVSKKYILLKYVAKYWPFHVCQSLQVDDPENYNEGVFKDKSTKACFKALMSAVSNCTAQRPVLTVWIEAAWMYKSPPLITELPLKVADFAANYSPRITKELLTLSETLGRLSTSLIGLNTQWYHVLEREPNEIWLPSVRAFTNSEFLADKVEATVKSLFYKKEDEDSMMIASQVSANGREIGMIKVWPPRKLKEYGDRMFTEQNLNYDQGLLDSKSVGNWKVAYQIWALETKKQVLVFQFEISSEQILKYSVGPSQVLRPTGFKFPVAFSPTLRLAVILGTVIQISDVESYESNQALSHRCEAQELLAPGCQYSKEYDYLLRRLHIPKMGSRFLGLPKDKRVHYDHGGSCDDWAMYYFHPNERYLAVMNGSEPPHKPLASFPVYVLDIYENRGSPSTPVFEPVASVAVRSSKQPYQTLCFHPSEPVLAISLLSITTVWRFIESGSSLEEVYKKPLNNLRFSDCGNFLYGMSSLCNPEIFAVPQAKVLPRIQYSAQPSSATEVSHLSPTVKTAERSIIQGGSTSILQSSGLPVFSSIQGQMQMSLISQNQDIGTIMRQTMLADGTVSSETILRTPKCSTLEKSYSTMVPTELDENIRLVLNMAAQASYSLAEADDFSLPAVVDRKRSTIPIHIFNSRQQIDGTGNAPQKRIADSQGEEDHRRVKITKRPRTG